MRIILCVLLSLVAAPAWAGWVAVAVAADDSITSYIDPDRIRKDGNLRKVWVVQDLKHRHADGEMSRRMLDEFDCKEERRQGLAISTHSEPMAMGETIFSFEGPLDTGHTLPPGSVGDIILRIVCAK